MPYNYNQEEDEEKQGQIASAQTPVMTGTTPSQQQSESKGSGRFTNLNQYLEANKPQAENLAGGIATGIEKETEQAVGGVQNLAKQYEEEVKKPTQYVNERFNTQSNNFDVSEEDINKAQALRENQSQANKRIEEMESYNPSMAQVEKAKQKAANLGTETGRFAALSDYVSGRGVQNYGKGMQKFDQLLLQSNPTTASRLQETQQKAKALETKPQEELKRVADVQKATQDKIQQNLANINQFSQAGQKAIVDPLQQRMEEFNRNMADTSPYAQKFGNLNALDYINFNPYRASNISEFATPEQVARANALAKLAGVEQTALSNQNLGAALNQNKILGVDLSSPQSLYDLSNQNYNQYQQQLDEMKSIASNRGAMGGIGDIVSNEYFSQLYGSPDADAIMAQYTDKIMQEGQKKNNYNNLINYLKGLK